jgi:hypothetical protein
MVGDFDSHAGIFVCLLGFAHGPLPRVLGEGEAQLRCWAEWLSAYCSMTRWAPAVVSLDHIAAEELNVMIGDVWLPCQLVDLYALQSKLHSRIHGKEIK